MLRAYVVFKNRVFYRGLAHALLYLSRREKTCTLLTSVGARAHMLARLALSRVSLHSACSRGLAFSLLLAVLLWILVTFAWY